MKSVQKAQQIFSLASKPTITQLSIPFSSSSTIDSITSTKPTQTQTQTLTQEDLTNINLLLPRLCLSGHLDTSTHLTITALLTNPPLHSLSLSILIHSFTSQPDMARPMSLLTRLRHNPPSHSYLTPITTMLIASYFKRKRPREALKLFNWMVRPGSPVVLDERVCGVLVGGFCRNGMVLEALNVLRAMLGASIVPGCNLRKWVYRGLLREARIREALELNEALDCVGDSEKGCVSEGFRKVLALLDHMIDKWTE
ncbi:putative pentatricopeptide [Rosa chinensis]|uniref:Putative pentatricopeptide n=1 Tax=Rosa chinensis TaxID=74649 RepID=A0A2P6Q7I4_ROSCH|nr:uncharacterized protein LOC112165194 [Rosa chinensis]PRQ30145.1 putative pentatricopeptide [Rosa chinensis]